MARSLLRISAIFVITLLTKFSDVATVGPSSFPSKYPGQPLDEFSPAWQTYFEVKDPLPNVTFDLGRSWAGNIPVNRAGHPNDTLFFWAFEKENGSLTDERSDVPWVIWLNGGPGSSSLIGLAIENGPITIQQSYSATANNYSWHKLADCFWIDQPVGTGFSTADSEGYVDDEDQMGRDFLGFLANIVKIFPSLSTRPLFISGESYAGVYIPYIMKTYFSMEKPPVRVAKIAIGDGSIGSQASLELPALSVIETYPQIIGYDPVVFNFFKEQTHLCGFDLNFTYPQSGPFPDLYVIPPDQRINTVGFSNRRNILSKSAFSAEVASRFIARPDISSNKRDRETNRRHWKRDLTTRTNGSIDPWYGCYLFEEMVDYAVNYTFPWTLGPHGEAFNVYNVPDAVFPAVLDAAMKATAVFLNDNRTRTALHAPKSKDWVASVPYPFGSTPPGLDPSVEPMAFLTEMAANASSHNISIIIYSGNDDALVSHKGSELAIQNTTFGGIQGFTRKPSTPWTDDVGNFAGIIHQERGWTYSLFSGAGHLVPAQKPAAAFTFLREFILGSNDTGLVSSSSGGVSVKGGEDPTLAGDTLRGQKDVYYGTGITQSTYAFPSATVAAWDSFFAEMTATAPAAATPRSAAQKEGFPFVIVLIPVVLLFSQL